MNILIVVFVLVRSIELGEVSTVLSCVAALLRRLSLKQIGDQIKQLAETDYAIKKGLAQPRVSIEQMVLKMTTM
jgi:DNA polymerase III delta subunit